jgi:hypothetical protein
VCYTIKREVIDMPTVIVLEDAMVCAEIIFVDGNIPYDRLFFGTVQELTKVLSETSLKELADVQCAKRAYVQNIYFRAKDLQGKWRNEFRLGSQGDTDIESYIFEEETIDEHN